jgi:hypothetical protein
MANEPASPMIPMNMGDNTIVDQFEKSGFLDPVYK